MSPTHPPRAVVLHGVITPSAPLDDKDTLEEVRGVAEALGLLGFETHTMSMGTDLARAAAELRSLDPRFVFNLVESIEGCGALIHLAPTLLEYLGIPYTGAGLEAMYLTSHKILAKRMMAHFGLPTPPWLTAADALAGEGGCGFPCIVKDAWEHASIGVSEEGIARSAVDLRRIIGARRAAGERHLYAERYIEGRELNLAVLGGEVLPPSEILFVDYPEDKPRIVDYRAKWVEDSFEYSHTPRSFDFPKSDRALIAELTALSASCWRLFGLRGYARVDFRIDDGGRPWIMEVNANPCINPDASGFVATAQRAGLEFPRLVERIVLDTFPEGLPLE